MAVITNVVDSSSTLTLNTPVDILDTTTVGFYEAWLDLNALAADDILVFRVSRKVRTGGTTRVHNEIYMFGTSYAAGNPKNVVFTPYSCVGWQLKFSIEQTAGTGRSIPYEVNRW